MYYLVIADSFLAAGLPDRADAALQSYVSSHPNKIATKEYQLRLAQLEEGRGNYKESLAAYKTYHAMSTAYDQRIIKSDTGFVEERLASADQQRRDHVTLILLIVAILSIVGVSALLILSLKNRNEHLAYSTSTSPTGPWVYGGVLMEEGPCFTNHPGIADFKGHSYLQ